MMIKGKELTLRWLKQQSQAIQNEVRDAVEDATDDIYQQAVLNAPGPRDDIDTTYGVPLHIEDNIAGMLDKSITNGGFTGSVSASLQASKFFVYVEFGTGADAARYVPTLQQEFQAFARQYYVNGEGTIIGRPFLLPAYFEHRTKFLDELRRITGRSRS